MRQTMHYLLSETGLPHLIYFTILPISLLFSFPVEHNHIPILKNKKKILPMKCTLIIHHLLVI